MAILQDLGINGMLCEQERKGTRGPLWCTLPHINSSATFAESGNALYTLETRTLLAALFTHLAMVPNKHVLLKASLWRGEQDTTRCKAQEAYATLSSSA